MIRPLPLAALFGIGLGLSLVPLHADGGDGPVAIFFSGVAGNSGGTGKDLVRFGPKRVAGLGAAYDASGSLWDRGGAGVLNRYAADGRLLASYKIPEAAAASDRLVLVGNRLVLLLAGTLYSLPVDAPADTAAESLKVPAGMISASSAGGLIALATQDAEKLWHVSLFNPEKNETTTLLPDPVAGLQEIELLPDKGLVARIDGKVHFFKDGKEVADGWPKTVPGDRLQFAAPYWYSALWHGTLRRFSAAFEPDPGVVLGGGSGSFIGHVDGNTEVEGPRGLAPLRPGLWAVSGAGGVLHLLQWDDAKAAFTIVRRIGAIQACKSLALNRQGDLFFNSGYWKWDDGADAPLHDCTLHSEEPGPGQAAMLPNDNFVVPILRGNKSAALGGPFSWETHFTELRNITPGKSYFEGSTIYKRKDGKLVFLTIGLAGETQAVTVGLDGRTGEVPLPTVKLTPAKAIARWTSLGMKDADTLLAAADGQVVEFGRDGDDWKETRRWNSWEGPAASKFGGEIHLSADGDLLWVADTERNRVLCFNLADGSLRGGFGTGKPGDGEDSLNAPTVIVGREKRAAVYDSANQRIVKLQFPDQG